jgi:glycosyltransferase involved in cell wall biosynthesis
MVALDFPPCQSAGVQRTLKFCEHLPQFGWDPMVLTVPAFTHEKVSKNTSLPPSLDGKVYRAWALNSVKHLSIKGKYIGFTAMPDRYMTWYWHGVYLGTKLVRKYKPDVIWSTFPYPSAHRIARELAKYTDIPWVADFRDPFVGHHFPNAPANNYLARKIDRRSAKEATHLTFTTQKAADMYCSDYDFLEPSKTSVIQNGFNETVFDRLLPADKLYSNNPTEFNSSFNLVYSGKLYGVGRSPLALFEAIAQLKLEGFFKERPIQLIFRGAEPEESFLSKLAELDIKELVHFLPEVPFEESIKEMAASSALLLLQGKVFNNQIPGKVYEYLRTCKPILALAHQEGATAELLNNVKHAVLADIEEKNTIAEAIKKLMMTTVNESFNYHQYSRIERTKQLANLLNEITEQHKFI